MFPEPNEPRTMTEIFGYSEFVGTGVGVNLGREWNIRGGPDEDPTLDPWYHGGQDHYSLTRDGEWGFPGRRGLRSNRPMK